MLPTGSGEQSHSPNCPVRGKGPRLEFPATPCARPPVPPATATPGPTPTNLAPAVRSGTAPPRVPGARSRNRNPERIRPASPGLVPEGCPSLLLAILAATRQETRAGPPVSFGLGRGLLGVVVLWKMVAAEKKFEFRV